LRKKVPEGFKADCLGIILTRKSHSEWVDTVNSPNELETGDALPNFHEEYFEWIDLIDSVKSCDGNFRFFELGAGYGRWSLRAAGICRNLGIKSFEITAVEGEPSRFSWMRENFDANGIDPNKHRLIQGAVSKKKGQTWFYTGKAAEWYGQKSATGREKARFKKDYEFQRVIKIAFKDLFQDEKIIDLIDLDIQGAELEVLSSGKKQLSNFVKKVHVGTHSNKIESGLRNLFGQKLKWKSIYDFSMGKINQTPYRQINFHDGVQSWLNPKFEG